MNTNNNYQIYVDSVLQLAATMVIKSDAAAEALNKSLVEHYGSQAVDALYPSTWKYYLNIAGEYHSTNTVMQVVSMDTLEKITFSKSNLKTHRATARGYAYGTRAYTELVSLYPDQEYLIRGILNPIDINVAIAADDGTILGYPVGYVEENEYSLKAKLQQWVNSFRERHVNNQFTVSDGLYTASWLAVMYMNLPLAILGFRMEACHTNEAHSYHVKAYLASHGSLDQYYDQLTTAQALWLYRNIRYLRNNTGKQENFDWLIEHIMTERRLPLAEFTMRHDVSRLQSQASPGMMALMLDVSADALTAAAAPTEPVLYPDIVFRKTPVNLGYNLTDNVPISLSRILEKEDHFARANPRFRRVLQSSIQEGMENSLSNVVATKFMESSMVDRSNNTPYTMTDILLNNWLSMSMRGNYRAYIGVTSPKSGARIPLQVKDAFIFYWYAYCRSFNIDVDTIPQVVAMRVPRTVLPTMDELMSVVSSRYITPSMASDVLGVMPVIRDVISTEAFYRAALELFDAAQYQRRYIASQEHLKRRGMMLNLVSRIYTDDLYELAPASANSYQQWFAERNIEIDTWTQAELGLVWTEILKEATGINLITTKSLKDLQRSMVGLLSQLSSYSIQINTDINSSDVRMSDWGMIRLGDISATLKDKAFLESGVYIEDVRSRLKDQAYFDVTKATLRGKPEIRLRDRSRYEISAKVRLPGFGQSQHFKMNAAAVRMRSMPKPIPNDLDITPVLGTDLYVQLPMIQRVNFDDIYGNRYTVIVPDGVPEESLPPLSSIITVTILDGLVYVNHAPPVRTELSLSLRSTWLDGFSKT